MFKVKMIDLKDQKIRTEFLNLMQTGGLGTETDRWLKWKYIDNPFNPEKHKPVILGVFRGDSEQMVGIRPFLSYRLIFNGKKINAVQPCDTVVHPTFRGKGLFSLMNQEAINILPKFNYDFFFNFPNKNSMPGCMKQGWQQVAAIDESYVFMDFSKVVQEKTGKKLFAVPAFFLGRLFRNYRRILKDLADLCKKDYIISREIDFSPEFEELWVQQEKRIRVERNEQYLCWKFKDRPDKKYEIVTVRENGKLAGYMIVTISQRWGSKEGQIVDFQYKTQEIFFSLLYQAYKMLVEQYCCDFISIWSFTAQELPERLKKLGFVGRESCLFRRIVPSRYMVVRELNPDLGGFIYRPENWSLRSSDQDTY